jgi:hypothetical protein
LLFNSSCFLHHLIHDPLLALVPRKLLQELVQDTCSEPKHSIDAPIDQPFAEHLSGPHHLPLHLLAFLSPLLLSFKPFFQLF